MHFNNISVIFCSRFEGCSNVNHMYIFLFEFMKSKNFFSTNIKFANSVVTPPWHIRVSKPILPYFTIYLLIIFKTEKMTDHEKI